MGFELFVGLPFGLVSLNVEIDLTQIKLTEPLLFCFAGICRICELVQLPFKATDALFARDYGLFSILKSGLVILEVNIGIADVQAQFWNDCNGSRFLLLRESPNMAHCFHQKRQTSLDVALDVATSSHVVESFIIQFRKGVQLVRIFINYINAISKHRHCSLLVSVFL